MLYIDERTNKISLTRGDTAYLEINIVDELVGGEYVMEENDILTLSVKKTVKDQEILLQNISKGSNTFHIEPEDTKGFDFSSYQYDVQLTKANGDVFTVIVPSKFEILPEVTV